MITFFDIETAPLPEEHLRSRNLLPAFEPPGNIKDPVKLKEREEAHNDKALADAALSPITGSVCAVGWMHGSDEKTYQYLMTAEGITEQTLLEEFWRHARNSINDSGKLVGFNIKKFDLPFLIRRSWVLGVKPLDVHNGKYFSDYAVMDLRDRWTFGDRYEEGNLATLTSLFGIGAKTGSGKHFHRLAVEDPVKAKEYLMNDVVLLPRSAWLCSAVCWCSLLPFFQLFNLQLGYI